MKSILSALAMACVCILSVTIPVCADDTIIFSQICNSRIEGESSVLAVKFSVSRDNEYDTILLEWKDKVVKIRKSIDRHDFVLYIDSYQPGHEEQAIFLKTDDIQILKDLKSELEKENRTDNLGVVLSNALNLLIAWPLNLSVKTTMDSEKVELSNAISTTRANFDKSHHGGVKRSAEKGLICSEVGRTRNANFVIGGILPIWDLWRGEFVGSKGAYICNGRCGNNCVGDGAPDNGKNTYSGDCFNHDVCCIHYGAGDPRCYGSFLNTVDDFLFGASCENIPNIESVSPSIGNAGDKLVITGKNFGTKTGKIIFGVVTSAKITYWTDRSIQAEVPASLSGVVSVFVDTIGNGRVEKQDVFTYAGTKNLVYKLINKASNKLLTIETAKGSGDLRGDDGAYVVQAYKEGIAPPNTWVPKGDKARWQFIPVGDGRYFYIVNRYVGKCINNPRGSISNRTKQTIGNPSGVSSEQMWEIIPTNDGYAYLKNKASGKCLDIPHGTSASGTPVEQYTCGNETPAGEQHWLLSE